MDKKDLDQILERHRIWVNSAGVEGARANLSSTDLRYADLRSADLRYADLRSADLSYADLRSADLSSTDLRYADLRSADLSSAKNFDWQKYYNRVRLVPEMGAFIAYKKALTINGPVTLTLEILSDAKRLSHFSGRKCRASAVRVLSVEPREGIPYAEGDQIYSDHDNNFEYKVGEVVQVSDFDEDALIDCSRGIHFFLTKQEALEW